MSIHVMNHVWRTSKAEGGTLLVLLAIADHADDNGQAYPSIPGIAEKARLKERQVHRVLKSLVAMEELQISSKSGPQGKNLYTVLMPDEFPVKKTPCQKDTLSKRHSVMGDTVSSTTGESSVVVSLVSSDSLESVGSQKVLKTKPSVKTTARARKPETFTPEILEPTPKHQAFAAKHHLDLPATIEHFLDYHRSHDSKHADWSAALMNWLRNAVGKYAPPPARGSPKNTGPTHRGLQSWLTEVEEKRLAEEACKAPTMLSLSS